MFKAPEIKDEIDESRYTNKIDIWSLGVILYYLCTGSY